MELYMDIYERYEKEVLGIVPDLRKWWNEMENRGSERATRAERWPFSFCAHPRYIEVYRRYFLEIAARTIELEEEEGEEEDLPITDDMWGQPMEEEEAPEIVYKPHAILRDHFLLNNSDLVPDFGYFLFVPIGSEDHLLITGGRNGDPS